MERERYPLVLLAAFSRALAHKIRTPLAVISNELSCLAAESPENVATATARTREIAEILKSACRITSAKVAPEKITLASLIDGLPEELSFTALRGDPALLKAALDALRYVFTRYGDGACSVVVGTNSNPEVAVRLVFSGPWSADLAPHESFSSLSELVSGRLSLDSLDAPLFDAVMLAHGIEMEISFEDARLAVGLTVPVAP
jgi:signal transduction histidine kinase